MNDEENLSTIEENEEEDDSLNNDTELTESEERKISEIEESVSSHGIYVKENSGSGVERLEMSFYGKSYSHNTHCKFMMIKEKYNVNEDVYKYQSLSQKVMFTKMNSKKGIKLFGERLIADMFMEYKQSDDGPMSVKTLLVPFNTDGLTPLDKNKTLEAVNLIKEKLCRNIKVRTCTNVRNRRKYLKPDESVYSPTF